MTSPFFLLLACQQQASSWDSLPKSNPMPSTETPEEESDSGSVSETSTEEDDCPVGMVPIPRDMPQYCIMQCEAAIHEDELVAQVGVIPKANTSFYQAQELCAQQVHAGQEMRLPRYHEWRDAADGIIGDGGYTYPWGNTEHQGECILPFQDVEWEMFLECGHLDSCVSPFGVFDQLGNLWEWVDSGHVVHIPQWFAQREAEGILFSVENNVLHLLEGSMEELIVFVVGLPPTDFVVEDGEMFLDLETPFRDDLPLHGYLMPSVIYGMATASDMLPIRLVFEEGNTRAKIVIEYNREGEPIAGKVGGAYYIGEHVQLSNIFWGHVPAFNGSVGFRCILELQ